jgi:hypothetical protein
MANVSKLRTLVSGIPTTIDLTATSTVLQTYDLQITNSGVTASRPAKLDSNKKITSGYIDLASEISGTLPIANGGTGSTSRNFVDLSSTETVAGVKTFSSFPVTPSSAPTTDYQVPNKKYVDDQIGGSIVGAMIYKGVFSASGGTYAGSKASLLSQGITYTAKANGIAGNDYSVTVIDSTTGGLSYTEVAAEIIIDLGGATPTTAQVVTLLGGSAYVDVAETTPGSVITAVKAFLVGGSTAITNPKAGYFYKVSVAGTISGRIYSVGDNMYINKDVVGNPTNTDIDLIDNTEIISSVNSKIGAVVLNTDDIAELVTPTNKWFTDTRAKTAAVANSITDGVTDVAPSQNAVFDALAGKSDTGHNHSGVYDPAGTAAGLIEDQIVDGVTTKAPSQNAVFDALALKDDVGLKTFPGVAGESLSANTTYAVRFAVGASETAGRVYKATSDSQNAAGKYTVCGIIQTTGAVSAGDAVVVIRYAANLALKSSDTVIGASTADNGKTLWLNKDGVFGLVPSTGITATESFANVMVGVIKNYNATVTSEFVMFDISLGNLTGIDIA